MEKKKIVKSFRLFFDEKKYRVNNYTLSNKPRRGGGLKALVYTSTKKGTFFAAALISITFLHLIFFLMSMNDHQRAGIHIWVIQCFGSGSGGSVLFASWIEQINRTKLTINLIFDIKVVIFCPIKCCLTYCMI